MTEIRPDLLQRLEYLAQWKDVDPNQLLEEWLDDHEYDRTLNEITVDAVITIDVNHHILTFNSSAENIFGYAASEVIGKSINILLPSSLHEIHQQHIEHFGQGDETKRLMNGRGQIQGRRKDGTHFPAEASIGKTGEDSRLQFHVILRDISERVAISQKLQQSEEKFRLLMNNILDFVCLHDIDGRYNYVSPSCFQITGYQVEELIGRIPYDFFHPDDKEYVREVHETILRGVEINSTIYRFQHKNGHYIWVETKTQPVINADGKISYIVTGTRDISPHVTTQQELEQERDLLEKIMETSPSGITVVDKSGQLDFSNKRAREILRLPESQDTERSYNSEVWKHTHYDGTPWPDEKQPFVRIMQTGEAVYEVQHAIESPNGQRVLLSINGAPLFDEDGNIAKVVFTIEDVTELKRAEQSLRESLKQEQQVTTLKSRFLSIVSHEFRTPLSVIMTSADILEHHLQGMMTEAVARRLEQIRHQVRYLDVQLDDVSTLNKANQTQTQLNLEQMFAIDLLYQLIAETELTYTDCPPIHLITPHKRNESFLLDPHLIQHIFSNLISNAAKYSDGQGEITIRLVCTDNSLHFTVRDKGRGIHEKDKENLFNYFYRGDNVGQVKGTGIGLAVVKQSVMAHDGTIEFESTLGVGSIFTVTIPIQHPASV